MVDGHLDLASRNVTVTRSDPLFAGMLRVTVDGQRFDLTVTEAL
jgi:NADPH-dependent ferric siderophore reductase